MKLYHISLNSLWRRKTRVIFLLIGLTVAVSTVVVLISISRVMSSDIAQKLDEYGANIVIVPRSDQLALNYGGMTVAGVSFGNEELHSDAVEKIRTIKNKENISIVAPKLLNVANIRNGRVLVVGVDFPSELALKKWWRLSGSAPDDPWDVLIGSDVREKLQLGLNQTLLINGQSFKVSGILEPTGSQDDGLIFMDLRNAQSLFNKPSAISLIEVAALCYDCPIEAIVAQTSEKLPGAKVSAIRQSIQGKMDTMQQFQNFSVGISAVILLVGALIVLTTMSASVNDRKQEIGIFRSIGFRQSHIMQIILLEALFLSTTAGLLGYLIGFGGARGLAPFLGAQSSTVYPDGSMLVLAVGLSVVIGMGAALQPALKAARLDPTNALRAL